jgi:hypothetical protein
MVQGMASMANILNQNPYRVTQTSSGRLAHRGRLVTASRIDGETLIIALNGQEYQFDLRHWRVDWRGWNVEARCVSGPTRGAYYFFQSH